MLLLVLARIKGQLRIHFGGSKQIDALVEARDAGHSDPSLGNIGTINSSKSEITAVGPRKRGVGEEAFPSGVRQSTRMLLRWRPI